jgi:hypothetical protein
MQENDDDTPGMRAARACIREMERETNRLLDTLRDVDAHAERLRRLVAAVRARRPDMN